MITRFAPSPTGPLHLGHAFSAILAHDMARAAGGQFLLRIEDIDRERSRIAWEDLIYDDLAWLGLTWDGPVMRQSERADAYQAALATLEAMGILYPCSCTRRDIQNALSAPQEGQNIGFDGPAYPGTCRGRRPSQSDKYALRIDMKKVMQDFIDQQLFDVVNHFLGREDASPDLFLDIGDVVLARKDIGTSYHLSVVVDDSAQKITDVVRGMDLFDATPIHLLLQHLLGLAHPNYHHHDLIRDAAGRRLAKRDDARAIRTYRNEGVTPDEIRRMVGL